jgi:hypothetical protein
MLPLKIRIEDFSNKKNYLELQNNFLGLNYRYSFSISDLREPLVEDFSIIDYSRDEEGTENYEELYFKNYIQKSIPDLFRRMERQIQLEIKRARITGNIDLQRYIDHETKTLDTVASTIKDNKFLFDDIIDLLIHNISGLLYYLSSETFERGVILDKRIKLKWAKVDLLVLLSLLRENGHIDRGPTNTELGLAIDQVFAYKDVKTEEFVQYRVSGKALNNINSSNESIKKSIARLKYIFSDKDFFNNI